ncbi:hypothetical protein [Halorubrum tebenquichense]|uniref:Lipoprotein n=1 Tax=Halorubrum tebenquichense DSM 14210 TaxID=1227485 RepID=M0DCJ4_9EURY|nr:hypothetical protein [Halorubrum tebenquichense]ELZ33190.1 hypothetical protein C472_14797 [Halorubrum tebenquichense DSM 14210]
MVRHRSPSRRRFLAGAAGVALASMAGCVDGDGETGNTDSEADDADDEADEGDDEADEADVPDLDLREANVVEVAFEVTDEGYAFDVSLHHDDDGEEGYANWWQVERLDGTRLARRELLHAHSEQPFTRSETVNVPDDASCVVVRGHDETHEYGGVAAVVDVDDAAVRRVDQGADPRSFDASDCP